MVDAASGDERGDAAGKDHTTVLVVVVTSVGIEPTRLVDDVPDRRHGHILGGHAVSILRIWRLLRRLAAQLPASPTRSEPSSHPASPPDETGKLFTTEYFQDRRSIVGGCRVLGLDGEDPPDHRLRCGLPDPARQSLCAGSRHAYAFLVSMAVPARQLRRRPRRERRRVRQGPRASASAPWAGRSVATAAGSGRSASESRRRAGP